MSWLFSQALAAEYSADICSAGAPSALSNTHPMPQVYCSPDKMTAFSRLSRFGMTFAPLMESHGAALLMSYLAAFPARTSAPQGGAKALMANAPASGARWHESSVRYCLNSSSWKTHRCLWEEALPWSSVTLPRWGMTASGVVFQHPTSERPISVTVSGLSVPTQTVFDATGKGNQRKDTNLGKGGRHGVSLHHFVSMWPTPTVRDYKSGKFSEKAKAARDSHSRGKPLNEQIGGQLNPTWVEWLMGWPLGWTDLKPLAMGKFREWQQQHSPCLPSGIRKAEVAA